MIPSVTGKWRRFPGRDVLEISTKKAQGRDRGGPKKKTSGITGSSKEGGKRRGCESTEKTLPKAGRKSHVSGRARRKVQGTSVMAGKRGPVRLKNERNEKKGMPRGVCQNLENTGYTGHRGEKKEDNRA